MTFALIYHDLAAQGERDRFGFPGSLAARYKLDPETFEAHMDAIASTGAHVGLLRDAPDAALTFDDGGASALRIADSLERRGWRAHFFITTGRLGTPGFLDAEAVGELARRGHEIGSHSHSHPTYMGALAREQLAREWRLSRQLLGEILGAPPRAAAVPGGFLSAALIDEAAKAGYGLLMTSQPTARVRWHDGLRVHGRYTIWGSTTPSRAAAYAHGDLVARAGLWIAWQAKTGVKRLDPKTYEAARRASARRGVDGGRREPHGP